MNRFVMIQIFGVTLSVTALIASAAKLDHRMIHLQDKQQFILMALCLGFMARSYGEAGALRLKYSDRTEALSRKQYLIAMILAIITAGCIIAFGKYWFV
ncbi:MAG: hypothetical protein EOP04_27990 [Proteobacteria bacterium]|nr:MAG: hypothetical protein EOP04_27990 [Pseudomonadota bacterium]